VRVPLLSDTLNSQVGAAFLPGLKAWGFLRRFL